MGTQAECKVETIYVRLSKSDKDLADKIAADRRTSLSSLMREALVELARNLGYAT